MSGERKSESDRGRAGGSRPSGVDETGAAPSGHDATAAAPGGNVPMPSSGREPNSSSRSDSARGVEIGPGFQIGEYVIESQIGRGAFGTVYGGVQPVIGKRVAIKVLSPALSSEPSFVSRFVEEARAVNK